MPRQNQPALLILIAVLSGIAVRGLADEPQRPSLVKLPIAFPKAMENTPLIYQGRPLLLLNFRDDTHPNTDGYANRMYLYLVDLYTGERLSEFGRGYSFVSGFVQGNRLHAFASQGTDHDWFQSIDHFWTDDLKTWHQAPAIKKQGDEHLLNSSVCRDEQGYLMAYESDQPVKFCFRFARSKDLSKWEDVAGLIFTGENYEYSACPVIRYFTPYYYVIYLHAAVTGHNGWISYIARSKDLESWQLSPMNPILEAGLGEEINNSDVDLFEWEGNTYLVYATGDQATWTAARMAMHPGPMQQFFEGWFPEGTKMPEVTTRRRTASP